ncbi:MAG: alpha/beta hydrolase [Syntrophales bacterium]|nr:alpha/beta hydrolase [Syntrophales bacterium]MDD5641319.1 alpha/beta hydrolase [Syntrophales bacterium]
MSEIRYPTPAEIAACLTQPAQVVETAAGPVEYAERGQGLPLLSVHGGPGGCDQGLGLGEFFRVNGFKTIAPSRPGYLGTPIATGRTPEEQADALAALLDTLKIEKCAAIGASAGGPSTYLLAARHPHRVSCLLEVDSVCLDYKPDVSPLEEKLFMSKAGLWLMSFFMDHFPESTVKSFLKAESTLDRHEMAIRAKEILQDESKFAFLKFLMATMSERYQERQEGVHNDLEQFAAITQLDLAPITCPTLIFHGTMDKDVPPRHGEYAKATIAGADFYWIDGGSHTGFWTAPEAQAAQAHALNWLRSKIQA